MMKNSIYPHHSQNTTAASLRIENARERHQMETFSVLLVFCAGNSPVTGEDPAQKPVARSFDVFFLSAPEWPID